MWYHILSRRRHLASICQILKMRTYSCSRSSQVINLGANRKCICTLLLATTNSIFGCISHHFRDIGRYQCVNTFSSKIAGFPPPLHRLTPPSGEIPWDINVIYTPLKSTFNKLQFCSDIIGLSSFVKLLLPPKIRRNYDKIWPYSSSRSSKVIDLGVKRKLTCDFLLVTNSNFGPDAYS